jgi:cell volume regulation protein A
MSTEFLPTAALVGASIVLVAIIGARFAGRLGVPGLLLYLIIGLILGSTVPALDFTDSTLAVILGSTALVLILAHGGLTTRADRLKPVLAPALVLASVGVAVSVAVVAIPLIYFLNVDPQVAVLLGAVLAATDAAAVFSVMRRIRVHEKVRTLLEAEAGFNDAPVVVIVSVVASGVWGTTPGWWIPILVLLQLIGGAAVGVGVGYLARVVLPRLALPAVGLYPIAALSMIILAFGIASVVNTSGFIAVYLAAVIIGSTARLPHRKSIVGFSDGLSWIAEIGLFVMLGLLAEVDRLPESLGIAFATLILLTLFARPISVFISLIPFHLGSKVIAFTAVAGLRGAVPIVFAAIPLGLNMPGAEIVFDTTLIVVLVLLLIQTPFMPLLGRRIGVCLPEQAQELEVESAPLDGMSAIVLSVDVPKKSAMVGVFVVEMGLPKGAVVSLVIRDGQSLVPDSHTRIKAGDQIVFVAPESIQVETEKRIRLISNYGQLGSWYVGIPRDDPD